MRVFVLGCNSLIGHTVSLYFKETGHIVRGYDKEPVSFLPHTVGDYYSTSLIEKAIVEFNPDAIINCVAIVNQAAEDNKAEASFINSYLPHFLERVTSDSRIIVVQRSTDCVFSGEKGHYSIDDTPDASSFYARTKAVGELINDKDITIRVSLIGPALMESDGSLLNWFLCQNGTVNGFLNSIWTGLTTLEYAKTVERLLNQRAHGLFQAAPDCSISKYNLLLMFEHFFPGNRKIIPVNNKRIDKSLAPYWGEYAITINDYATQMQEMKSWIEAHPTLYPKYYYVSK